MAKRSFLYYGEMDSPVGPLTLITSNYGVCRIDFGTMRDLSSLLNVWKNRYFLCGRFVQDESKVKEEMQQLTEYFTGNRDRFTMKLDLYGTPFQQKVWKTLYEKVPYGYTNSYKDVAAHIKAPKAVRAIGGAVNKNPVAIVIPCHRVIGSNGSLVGYNGGIEKKKYLLTLEKAAPVF